MYNNLNAGTIKRHATEMSHDIPQRNVSSRKTPRWNCQHDSSLLAEAGPQPEGNLGGDAETSVELNTSSHPLANISIRSFQQPDSSVYTSSPHNGAENVQATQSLPPHETKETLTRQTSQSNCQEWLSGQPEECREADHESPTDRPSTVYEADSLEMSDLNCNGNIDLDASCHGALSMCTYLATKGPQCAFEIATWEDVEDMLEKVARLDLVACTPQGGLCLSQLIELIPPAAKEAHQEIGVTAIDSWLLACRIARTERMENDALLEVLNLVCIEICDLGTTVFWLACFVAGLMRNLAEMSYEDNSQNLCATRGHKSSSSWSSGRGSGQRVYTGHDNDSAPSSNTFEMGETSNTSASQHNNGKRKFSGGQDRGDGDFEADHPGPEGDDDDEPGARMNLTIRCVTEKRKASHSYISVIIRCLKKHKVIVCGKCWDHFPNEKSFKAHVNSQKLQSLQHSATGKQNERSACEDHCVYLCHASANEETLQSAEAIKNRRHRFDEECFSKTRSPELRSAQWRYLYALTHPECQEVPDLR
ncbi:hypothetical protein BST61_g11079 [Cercospora zeina]